METIRGQLVELLRKAVADRENDIYVPVKELAGLVDIWEQLNAGAGGGNVVRVVLEGETEGWAN